MVHVKKIALFLLVVTASVSFDASAEGIVGKITTESGKPVFGAMLTVWNEEQTRKETVYTNAMGEYAILTDFGGTLEVRARLVNFSDTLSKITINKDQVVKLDLVIKHFETPEDRSAALSASAHAAKLPWRDDQERAPFISQCNYCHQLGNDFTRTERSQKEWLNSVETMETYFAMLSADEKVTIVKALTAGFDGKPVDAVQNYGANELLANAKVEQWLVGDSMSFLHDTDVGHDGKLYGTDEGHDMIWVLDRESHKIESYKIPSIGLPVAGKFATMSFPIGIFTGEHGPHSMAGTKDGKLWITNSLSSTLLEFDTKTKDMKLHPIHGDALYPHTIRTASDETLWFSINVSNQLGHYNPKTDIMEVFALPSNNFLRWISDMLLPTIMHASSWFERSNLPLEISHHKFFGHKISGSAYGLDINPKDGSVWVTQLYDHTIVRFDPQTKEMKSIPTPYKGPRRPRFDKDGILWIPAFDDGVLMRFDPENETFKNYKLPLLADNEYEVPYALNVHPETGDVWITANATDRVLRFFPKTETFMSYPSPTRVTVLRDLVFTKDGRVCNSTSNLPAYAMEDGVDTFFCIDPDGGAKDKRALAKLLAQKE